MGSAALLRVKCHEPYHEGHPSHLESMGSASNRCAPPAPSPAANEDRMNVPRPIAERKGHSVERAARPGMCTSRGAHACTRLAME